jgi:7,8-dihydro-6-hydroxymethylpterin-pyrophosphokinase
LEPLAELAPDLRHPVWGSTVYELLKKTKVQKLRRVARPRAGEKLRKNYL